MLTHLAIEKVIGREIIDSRGNPTVEAEVTLTDGTVGRGAAPSGASTGEFEAIELRDGDKSRFGGKGVKKAVENINTVINDVLHGMDPQNIYAVDAAMLKADGTENKSTQSLRFRLQRQRQLPSPSAFRCTASSAAQTATTCRCR